MLNKTLLAIAAVLALGAASPSFGYEAPENKLGDRYPALEQTYRPIQVGKVANRQVQTVSLYANEVPEHMIGDRYAHLVATIKPVKSAVSVRTIRVAKPFTVADKALFDRQTMRVVF